MPDRSRAVCVIGAGPSGLAAVKNLREYGFAVDCYERESGVGGAWHWRHDRSPIYAGTRVVTSRPLTQFPDFPMPDSWPDYPDHTQLLRYLERYADHFGLRDSVWYGTEVVRVSPAPGQRWDVTTRSSGRGGSEHTQRYAAVVVASGHNRAPRLPSYPGLDDFTGEVIHSSAYKEPTRLRGRRVLVVGGGNSGCDIAVEAAQRAERCWHSTRRGYWYLPKYLLGRPVDQFDDALRAWRVPLAVRQWLFHRLLRLVVGDLTRFGLPSPDHRVFQTPPIVNSQLVYFAAHQAITAVPDVVRFHRGGVELTDGRMIEPDLVVLATGYRPGLEFLDPQALDVDDAGRPALHLHTFARRQPTLALVGLLQPDSGFFTVVHWQTVAIARWLRMCETAPQRAAAYAPAMSADPPARRTRARTTVPDRHWFAVSHATYLRQLQRALDAWEAPR